MLQKARREEARKPFIHTCTMEQRLRVRNSLLLIGWTEQHIMLFDIIAWEKHINVATTAERIRNSTHWILTLNQDGAQPPLHQRPDFAQAKRECKRLHDEHMAKTRQDF